MKLDQLNHGDVLQEIELPPVTRLDLIKYAGASGDYNPIHTIDEEAKKAGLPGIVAHGMWTMGNLAKLFTPFYEEGYIEKYRVRFVGMVFLGDVIRLQGKLMEHAGDRMVFEVRAVNQKDQAVITGEVVFKRY
ncbi:MAG: dehydratase [Bacillaceae bacterium]|nr:dehydratase [Bacillaceae bacterium]